MRILFVAQYFPPMNSTGARRILSLSKNLAAMGHDVLVVTMTKSAIHGELSEPMPPGVRVIEVPRPSVVQGVTPMHTSKHPRPWAWARSVARRALRLVLPLSGQLLDRGLVFAWHSTRNSLVANETAKADVVVSTSPPWTAHLAAKILTKRSGVPWVLDYRDQFSGSHLNSGSHISRPVERLLDRWLVRSGSASVAISPAIRDYYSRWDPACRLIYNGFDPDMVDDALRYISEGETSRTGLMLRFVGTYPIDQPPRSLLSALERVSSMLDLHVEVVGDNSSEFLRDVESQTPSMLDRVSARAKVSSAEALRLMADADILLLIETWDISAASQVGVATTKVFEHMAVGRPTLAAVDPKIEAVSLLRQSGLLVGASQKCEELVHSLRSFAERGPEGWVADRVFVEQFSRVEQAKEYEELLESLVLERGQ